MSFFQAFILGIVEGITEFLPISSTGHLILASELLGISTTEFLKSFEIAIQAGAILAVIVLYRKVLFTDWKVFKLVAAAFIPTAILGFACYKLIKKYFLASSELVLVTLFVGGILLILFEKFHRQKEDSVETISTLSYQQAFSIGLFQSIALIPGVSRAAATILGGLFLGVGRKTIVEFSFLLAVPTMLAATGFDLLKSAHAFSSDQTITLAVGFVTSFIVAILSIRFFLRFIQNHTFVAFGIYRIAAALLFWIITR